METTSNRRGGCGARDGDEVVDWAERCDEAMTDGSRRPRKRAVQKDFPGEVVITMAATDNRGQKFRD